MEPDDDYDTIKIRATEPVFGMYVGIIDLRVHHPRHCSGQTCCIHDPSNHRMVDFPQLWRDDRKLMERTCPHGVGHPDPDALEHQRMRFGDEAARIYGLHGCPCNCCGVDL